MMSSKTPDTHGVCLKPKENFFTALKHDHHVHKNSLFGHPKPIPAKIAFEVGMKSKKSPPAHVFDLKIRLRRRAMFWFALTDRYDVKQDFRHTWCVLRTQRKFFHGTKARPSVFALMNPITVPLTRRD